MKLRKNECPWMDDDNARACRLGIGDNVYGLCDKHAEMQSRLDEEDAKIKAEEERDEE